VSGFVVGFLCTRKTTISAISHSWTARLRCKAGILLNEHIAEDGLTVFAHACELGAERIVSRDGAYQSGPWRVWIKVSNPASIAVQRERSEFWNR
jgi:ATP-dependent DNA ligase